MTLPLFWRLTLGYAAILLLSVCASIYAIVQLGELSQTARAALNTDYRTIGHQEALTDAFLSEVRYGGKYLLAQSPSSLDQFRQFKKDFLVYLDELKEASIGADTTTQLVRVEHLHQSFHELFEREVGYLKAKQPYAQSRYQQEREKLLDNTLRELARLKDRLEQNVHAKLERLGGTSSAARNIAIVTTLSLLILGTALSLKISTSVTTPLLELTNRSKHESADDTGNAPLSRIPEIQELSDVLNWQKQRLLRAAAENASNMEQLTEELADRLTSLKRHISDFKTKQQTSMSPQGRASIDSIITDTDRLVQYCVDLNASAAARTEAMKILPHMAQEQNADPLTLGANAWLMRELPDRENAPKYGSKPIAERCAAMITPLLRRLTGLKITTDKQDT